MKIVMIYPIHDAFKFKQSPQASGQTRELSKQEQC